MVGSVKVEHIHPLRANESRADACRREFHNYPMYLKMNDLPDPLNPRLKKYLDSKSMMSFLFRDPQQTQTVPGSSPHWEPIFIQQ